MKSDNISHFIYQYVSIQTYKIPLLSILIEHECELDGNWLENIPMIDMQSIFKEIRHYLNPTQQNRKRFSSRTSVISANSPIHTTNLNEIRNQSRNYMQCPVSYWSLDDVRQWCESTQGNFETLRPLITRLNGPALIHFAEILSIEPASMYHSLNDELLQRTGVSVPLTEYVSLQSELQRLLKPKQNERLVLNTINCNNLKKKTRKNSRFCTLF